MSDVLPIALREAPEKNFAFLGDAATLMAPRASRGPWNRLHAFQGFISKQWSSLRGWFANERLKHCLIPLAGRTIIDGKTGAQLPV